MKSLPGDTWMGFEVVPLTFFNKGVTVSEYFAPASSPVRRTDSWLTGMEPASPVLRFVKSTMYELGWLPLKQENERRM